MPVMGAMSTKIALHAGLLLVAARIDMHSISAAIDPSTPVSVASPALAPRLGLGPYGRAAQRVSGKHDIGIDDRTIGLSSVRVDPQMQGVDFLIGSDLLRHAPIVLDFTRRKLRVGERRDADRFEKRLTPIPASISSDGCLSLEANDERGRPIQLALIGEEPLRELSRTVKFGGLTFPALPGRTDRCSANDATIGWSAFVGKKLVLDLDRGRIWIGAS